MYTSSPVALQRSTLPRRPGMSAKMPSNRALNCPRPWVGGASGWISRTSGSRRSRYCSSQRSGCGLAQFSAKRWTHRNAASLGGGGAFPFAAAGASVSGAPMSAGLRGTDAQLVLDRERVDVGVLRLHQAFLDGDHVDRLELDPGAVLLHRLPVHLERLRERCGHRRLEHPMARPAHRPALGKVDVGELREKAGERLAHRLLPDRQTGAGVQLEGAVVRMEGE